MGHDKIRDILALAELEEADEVTGLNDADPLGFRWAVPLS
jgi:hypothetical protein